MVSADASCLRWDAFHSHHQQTQHGSKLHNIRVETYIFKPDWITAATETRDATLNLANQLLTTPVFGAAGAAALVHYSAAE